jgi:hypothetical protein
MGRTYRSFESFDERKILREHKKAQKRKEKQIRKQLKRPPIKETPDEQTMDRS